MGGVEESTTSDFGRKAKRICWLEEAHLLDEVPARHVGHFSLLRNSEMFELFYVSGIGRPRNAKARFALAPAGPVVVEIRRRRPFRNDVGLWTQFSADILSKAHATRPRIAHARPSTSFLIRVGIQFRRPTRPSKFVRGCLRPSKAFQDLLRPSTAFRGLARLAKVVPRLSMTQSNAFQGFPSASEAFRGLRGLPRRALHIAQGLSESSPAFLVC